MKPIKSFHRKWVGLTEYYNVYSYIDINKDVLYHARYKRVSKLFDNIKLAAKWVDMKLIEDNKEPMNILKRK